MYVVQTFSFDCSTVRCLCNALTTVSMQNILCDFCAVDGDACEVDGIKKKNRDKAIIYPTNEYY